MGLRDLVRRGERWQALDGVTKPLTSMVGRLVRPRIVRNVLSGTPFGHPAHPPLTDIPVGTWCTATVLDAIGGPRFEQAADVLIAAGVVAAVPTAASGFNDWADTYGSETRVGLLHAGANSIALGLYGGSLTARRRGDRGAGRALARGGLAALVVGGYLGGHLSYVRGVGINQAAWEGGPADWTPTMAESDLPAGQSRRVDVAGVAVLLYRQGEQILAIGSVCSHAGGPLEQGTITEEGVTCPWHGSIFCLTDGTVHRGPARTPQPQYQTRVHNGQIEIRRR